MTLSDLEGAPGCPSRPHPALSHLPRKNLPEAIVQLPGCRPPSHLTLAMRGCRTVGVGSDPRAWEGPASCPHRVTGRTSGCLFLGLRKSNTRPHRCGYSRRWGKGSVRGQSWVKGCHKPAARHCSLDGAGWAASPLFSLPEQFPLLRAGLQDHSLFLSQNNPACQPLPWEGSRAPRNWREHDLSRGDLWGQDGCPRAWILASNPSLGFPRQGSLGEAPFKGNAALEPAGSFVVAGEAGPAGPGAGGWESAYCPVFPFPKDQEQCPEDTESRSGQK